ncbi:surfactant protein Bb [Eucyclogobius newberryi]|uniref:surfactant protein Bb n=1 Tax=Eucyclogobius newberryi TaxID=166745 RepID=UPI003B5BFF75
MAHSGFITAAALLSVLGLGSSRMVPDPFMALKPKDLSTDVCSECSGLLLLSNNMISSSSSKAAVYDGLLSLCGRLSPHQAVLCQKQVDTHLSRVLQQSQSPVKSSANCGLFGLCAETGEEPGPSESTSEKVQFGPVCTLCVMMVKKLETLLPKNMTEDTIRMLLSEVCSLLPVSYQEKCEDFVQKYGEEIVEFLLSSAAPHTICTLLHLCLLNDTPAPPSVPSDCGSCQTLSVLSRVHLGMNRTEPQTSAFLRSVCSLYPRAIPKCDAFTRGYSAQLLRVLGQQPDGPEACEKADLCVPMKQAPGLGAQRCMWGPSYWCRDMRTAQECGNQLFCKKFVWK